MFGSMRPIVAVALVAAAWLPCPTASAADAPLAEPVVTASPGPQHYLHLQLPGVLNTDQVLNVSLAFHPDGSFARAWAVADHPNRGIVYSAGNRKVTRAVERQVRNRDLSLEDGRLRGSAVFRIDGYEAVIGFDAETNDGAVSGQWSRAYPAADGAPNGVAVGGELTLYLSGDGQSARLDLDQARTFERMGKYDSRLHNLRLRRAADGSVSHNGVTIPSLTWTDQRLHGELPTFSRIANPDPALRGFEVFARYQFDVELPPRHPEGRTQRARTTHTGQFHIAHDTSGTLTGHLIDETTMAARQVIDPAHDWPAWRGPFSDFRGHDSGYPLVQDLRNARLMWKSDPTPPGRAQDKRYFTNNHNRGIGGGGNSPIVYDGKVYQVYIRPAGDAYDRAYVERIREAGLPLVLDQWRVLADDVIQCMDLTTGRTLWRTTLPERGMNYAVGSKSGGNLSPAAGDGRIYMLGSTMRLYALDANDGSLLWETDVGAGHQRWDRTAREAAAAMALTTWNRSNNGSAVFHDGVVVVPNFTREGHGRQRLHGFDAATGERLWSVDDISSHDSSAAIWSHGDRHFVICPGYDAIACIGLHTGEEIWRVDGTGNNARQVVVSGDYLLTQTAPIKHDNTRAVTCYRVSLSGAEVVWSHTNAAGYNLAAQAPANGTHAYLWARDGHGGIDLVELASGDVTASFRGAGDGQNAFMLLADGRFIKEVDGTHSLTQMLMVDANPERLRPLSRVWNPPHHQSTGYAHAQAKVYVDGRLVLRGNTSIAAYDLRAIAALSNAQPGSGELSARMIAPWLDDLPGVRYAWQFSDGHRDTQADVSHTISLPDDGFAHLARAELVVTADDGSRLHSRHAVPVYRSVWPAAALPADAANGLVVERFAGASSLDDLTADPSRIDLVATPRAALAGQRGLGSTAGDSNEFGGGLRLSGWVHVAEAGAYRIQPPVEWYGLSVALKRTMIEIDGTLVYHRDNDDVLAAPLVPLAAGWHQVRIATLVGAKTEPDHLGIELVQPATANWFRPIPDDAWRRPADVSATPEPVVDPIEAEDDAFMEAMGADDLGF